MRGARAGRERVGAASGPRMGRRLWARSRRSARCARLGRPGWANRSLRIRLTVAGLLLWNHFSLTEECRVHVSQAIEELDAAGLAGTAFEMKLKLWLGGSTMFTRGLKPQAMDAMRRALEIAVQTGDTDYRLRCLLMIAVYELFTGEHDAAIRTLETFVSVAAAADPSALPEGETHLGIA